MNKEKMCRAVNKYHSDFDVNIQRGTMWGNYVGKNENCRDDAIDAFKQEFIRKVKTREITRDHLETLRGMRLGCTCKPKRCHGDIIAEVVNRIFKDIRTVEDLCKL